MEDNIKMGINGSGAKNFQQCKIHLKK
jgi:hypothetical protein